MANLPEVSRYLQQINSRCHWQGWQNSTISTTQAVNLLPGKMTQGQLIWTIWDYLQYTLKWTWMRNFYLFVNSTSQWCPNKIVKTFLIEDFFHLPLIENLAAMSLQIMHITINIWQEGTKLCLLACKREKLQFLKKIFGGKCHNSLFFIYFTD